MFSIPANRLGPPSWQAKSTRPLPDALFVQAAFAPPSGSIARAMESARVRSAFGTASQKMPNVHNPPRCTGLGSSSTEPTWGVWMYLAVNPSSVATAPVTAEYEIFQMLEGSFGARSEERRVGKE